MFLKYLDESTLSASETESESESSGNTRNMKNKNKNKQEYQEFGVGTQDQMVKYLLSVESSSGKKEEEESDTLSTIDRKFDSSSMTQVRMTTQVDKSNGGINMAINIKSNGGIIGSKGKNKYGDLFASLINGSKGKLMDIEMDQKGNNNNDNNNGGSKGKLMDKEMDFNINDISDENEEMDFNINDISDENEGMDININDISDENEGMDFNGMYYNFNLKLYENMRICVY